MVIGLIDPLLNFVGALCGVSLVMFIVLAAAVMFGRLAGRILSQGNDE
jgi:hypothetical protein